MESDRKYTTRITRTPVPFTCKRGKEELPIVDQYTYLSVELSKYCSSDAHIAKVAGKGYHRLASRHYVV